MLRDRNKYIDRNKCDICGKSRKGYPAVLYGFNTRYACCYDCYELYGTALNRVIERERKNYEGY